MSKLNVRVNRKRPESMTRQIREQLDELIDAGTLAAGTLLPSERDLANTLKVARNVVRGAYEQLMEAGKLRSEGRRGRSRFSRVLAAPSRKWCALSCTGGLWPRRLAKATFPVSTS